MTTPLTLSTEHRDARRQATIDFADLGASNSRIKFYNAADTLLATITLAKPCGSIVSHAIVLEQDDPLDDIVVVTGTASYANWINGNDVLVASGAVTTDAGDGPFRVAGTSSGTLFAGGLAILGDITLDG